MTEPAPRLLKIEKLPNLYRLLLPGDKPNKPTGFYYAAIKRGRKQFRRSLKTADCKLAERRLAELKNKVGNLVATDEADLSFDATAQLWLAITGHELKPRSLERRRSSLKALAPFFLGLALRNVTKAPLSTESYSGTTPSSKSLPAAGLPTASSASHIRSQTIITTTKSTSRIARWTG